MSKPRTEAGRALLEFWRKDASLNEESAANVVTIVREIEAQASQDADAAWQAEVERQVDMVLKAEAIVAMLREALDLIAAPGCEASRWANENPPVWDRCLDSEYVESRPDRVDGDGPLEWPGLQRCGPCEAHAAPPSMTQAYRERVEQRDDRPLLSTIGFLFDTGNLSEYGRDELRALLDTPEGSEPR